MMTYDPSKRITAQDALKHPWFNEHPLPSKVADMPEFPSLNEISREQLRKKRKNSLDDEQRRQREEMHDKEDRYQQASTAAIFAKKNYTMSKAVSGGNNN